MARREIKLPTTSPVTKEIKRLAIEKNARETHNKKNEKVMSEYIFEKKIYLNGYEVIGEDGNSIDEAYKSRLGERNIWLRGGRIVFDVSYTVTCDNEGRMASYRSWTETRTKTYVIADYDVEKYKKEREEFFDKKRKALPVYSWGASEQKSFDDWLEKKRVEAREFKVLYDALVERSKSEILTSKRVEEIERAEEYFKEYDIPYTKWSQPTVFRTLHRETEEYECYSLDSETAILDEIMGEWGVYSDDLSEDGKLTVGDISFEVQFFEPYGFEIWIRGNIQLGSMGMGRLKLEEIYE